MTPQAAISIDDILILVENAYEEGYNGCLDCRKGYAIEAVESWLKQRIKTIPKLEPLETWRKYKVEELQQFSPGTIFEHESLGRGWVEINSSNEKYMRFENNDVKFFAVQGTPWDKNMRRLKIGGSHG